jgi:acyl-CoA synthetase (AMP-forming)/AMP-acid ligase II
LEVEAAMNALPEVELSLVAGLPDAELGEMVVAAVEAPPDATVDTDALAMWLAERVAPYQRPRRIQVMELPTSADLKVKRRLVADLLRST